MPNGARPSNALKQKILEILNRLQLDGDQITGTSLGKTLHSIYMNDS
jgi:hypothetical protein